MYRIILKFCEFSSEFFKTSDYSQLNSFKSPEKSVWYFFFQFHIIVKEIVSEILHISSKGFFSEDSVPFSGPGVKLSTVKAI